MATKQKARRRADNSSSRIIPDRLYSYAELGKISGLGERKIRRRVEEGAMGYVQIGRERGRMVRGQQYLTWLDSHAVEAED